MESPRDNGRWEGQRSGPPIELCLGFPVAAFVLSLERAASIQEHVRPEKLSLTPPFLLPAAFLACMAEFLLEGSNITAGRTPVLAEIQAELQPFLLALSIPWIGGTSEAAARYRRLTGVTRAPSQQEQTLLTRFE